MTTLTVEQARALLAATAPERLSFNVDTINSARCVLRLIAGDEPVAVEPPSGPDRRAAERSLQARQDFAALKDDLRTKRITLPEALEDPRITSGIVEKLLTCLPNVGLHRAASLAAACGISTQARWIDVTDLQRGRLARAYSLYEVAGARERRRMLSEGTMTKWVAAAAAGTEQSHG